MSRQHSIQRRLIRIRRLDWRWGVAVGAAIGLTFGLWAFHSFPFASAYFGTGALIIVSLVITWNERLVFPRRVVPKKPKAEERVRQPTGSPSDSKSRSAEPSLKQKEPSLSERLKDHPEVLKHWPKEILIPAGTFLMGSPDSDGLANKNEKPQHQVKVSSFLMMSVPVTRGLWRAVMKKEPDRANWPAGKDRLPASSVTWYDAVAFCNELSKICGYEYFYQKNGDEVHPSKERQGFHLPTEAQWEYAARGGQGTRYFFGDESAKLIDYAWFDKGFGDGPFEVGLKKPNPFGLYDILGNVWEWCEDWYGPYPDSREVEKDPTGLESGDFRVLRGGSYRVSAGRLRCAYRDWNVPTLRFRNSGFRCVRPPPSLD